MIGTGTAKPIAIEKINYGPKESVIMRKSIAALTKVGEICQIHDGAWLFKALLAPKPHQEHICNIEDFIWRFCFSYILLNMVTCMIAYPIPCCESAVMHAFGRAILYWLFNAIMGYHQMAVSTNSQEKLAFQGPDTIKWTYTVMPFGPTNGPATFIQVIHDLESCWKSLAVDNGIKIDDDTNTNIIVNYIFNWAPLFNIALYYLECQLWIFKAYRLTLSLKRVTPSPNAWNLSGSHLPG